MPVERRSHTWVDRLFAISWHAERLYRWARYMYRNDRTVLAALLTVLNRIITGVDIGAGAQIGRGLVIMHGHGIVIDPDVVIGDNCIVYQQVTLGGRWHDRSGRDWPRHQEAPTLGDDVTIYAGAKVCGGVTIGNSAVIAANAVVLNDVPAGATVAGVPATVVRHTSNET